MSQTYEDRPTLAAFNALGSWEKISEKILTEDTLQYSFDLSNIDWSNWLYVALSFNTRTEASTVRADYSLNGSALNGRCSQVSHAVFQSQSAPFLMIFLPLHDGTRQVRAVCFGHNSTFVVGNISFEELETLDGFAANNSTRFYSGSTWSLWGKK